MRQQNQNKGSINNCYSIKLIKKNNKKATEKRARRKKM